MDAEFPLRQFRLSFCNILQWSDFRFELLVDEGLEISAEQCREVNAFWPALREQPYVLLVNCEQPFSYSFEASMEIGDPALQERVAIYTPNAASRFAHDSAVALNLMRYPDKKVQLFDRKVDALDWLAQGETAIRAQLKTNSTSQ
ncbi:hypothetical protein [Ferrimonas marina]|uniref:SpoIIAA-like n=1 Tax=Ferrimonas marina TaxID=299255 RepID=A0A1M5RB26_9GAMM|nr:hypothetical protein [Ferrimonas marina]SHH23013.1 hypothetical protein SAMN02745129_1538 [Ferrimonas marina]